MDNVQKIITSIIATFIICGILYAIGKKKNNPKLIRIACVVLVLEVSFACGGVLFGLILSGVYFLAHYLDNKARDEMKSSEQPTAQQPTQPQELGNTPYVQQTVAPIAEVVEEKKPELTAEERKKEDAKDGKAAIAWGLIIFAIVVFVGVAAIAIMVGTSYT